jgi:MoxR-like ATPase
MCCGFTNRPQGADRRGHRPLCRATGGGQRPNQEGTPDFINEWVSWGAGTRAGQYLVLGAKARALLRGRAHVTVEDIRTLARPVLRHRVLLNYRAEAEGIRTDEITRRLLETVLPSPVES